MMTLTFSHACLLICLHCMIASSVLEVSSAFASFWLLHYQNQALTSCSGVFVVTYGTFYFIFVCKPKDQICTKFLYQEINSENIFCPLSLTNTEPTTNKYKSKTVNNTHLGDQLFQITV